MKDEPSLPLSHGEAMSNALIHPVTDSNIPRASLALLERVGGEDIPNFLKTVAHSPAALECLFSQFSAAARTRLPPRSREAIALRVAELNGCDYSLAVHTALAGRTGVDAATTRRYRQGLSDDPKEQALLALATKVVLERGHHTRFTVETARRIGASEAEIVEVIALVGLSTLANYLSSVANTALDHPAAQELGTAETRTRPRS